MQNKLYLRPNNTAGVPVPLEAPGFSFFETAVEIARKEIKTWKPEPCECINEAIPCFRCDDLGFDFVNTSFYPQAGICAAGDDEFEVVKEMDR
jgi:hypothetical protein